METEIEDNQVVYSEGVVYELFRCTTCKGVMLTRRFESSSLDPRLPQVRRKLYPSQSRVPEGLPPAVSEALEAAERLRTFDANAYGMLIRRVIETVCLDRKAVGKQLNNQLRDLAKRGEIPATLAGIASNLRQLGNVAAHPSLGTLTAAEVPTMHALCTAILEYVYSAPELARRAETLLRILKERRDPVRATADLDIDSDAEN